MRAPFTQPARPRPPVAAIGGPLDGLPQGQHLALGGPQVRLVGRVPNDLPVPEVHELQQPRNLPARPPQHQRVELHLEQRPGLEVLRWRLAGLVVDDPDLPGRRDVEAVDVAAEPEPGLQFGLDVQLAVRGLEAAGILQPEITVHRGGRVADPGVPLGLAGEQRGQVRLGGRQPVPFRLQQRARRVQGPFGRRQVEQALQHRVHERPAGGGGARRLGQFVDDPEPVQQRAGHEIGGPGRR